MKLEKIPESQGTTESAVINSASPKHTSSMATAFNQGMNYLHTTSENTWSSVSTLCVSMLTLSNNK